jgi:uncharacterized membrane-anchored protein
MNHQTSSENQKLPDVNISFWVMVVTATTLGETAGDLLSMTMKLGYLLSTVVLLSLFVVALALQLRARHPHKALFWTVIVLSSTAGTTLSDYVNRSLGLGYTQGTLLLLGLLAAVFVGWRLSARSLAVDAVRSVKTESLYWAAILLSSTLGTALGDFLADVAGLGFGGGTLTLALLLALVALAARFTAISPVLLFWLGIIITHPIGATMGDYLTKVEGFNMGPLPATLLLLLVFGVTSIVIHRRNKAFLGNH